MKFKNAITKYGWVLCTTIILGLLTSCGGGGGVSSDMVCSGDYLFPFQEDRDKDWGFIDINGNVIIEPEFDNEPSAAINNIALITNKKRKHFFVRIEGDKAVEDDNIWDWATPFSDGMAMVRNENEKVQFIDEDFKSVLKVDHEEVGSFNNGLAHFKSDGKWGFMDKSGATVIEARYDEIAFAFSSLGYAIVKKTVGKEGDKETETLIINKSGEEVLNLKDKYRNVMHGSIDKAWFLVTDDDGDMGFVNLEGDKVIKPKDLDYLPFVNGYATFHEDGEWGLIDEENNKVLKAKYEEPLLVHNGLIIFKEDGEKGAMDLDGKEVFEPEYKNILPFMCNNSFAQDGDEWIVINQSGDEIKLEADIENVRLVGEALLLNLPNMITQSSDYFDASGIAGIIDIAGLLKAKTAKGALQYVGMGPKDNFLTSSKNKFSGDDDDWQTTDESYRMDCAYESGSRLDDYTLYLTQEYMLDLEHDGAEPSYESDEIKWLKSEPRTPKTAPLNVRSIFFSARCDGPMAKTGSKTCTLPRRDIEDLSRSEQGEFIASRMSKIVADLGYMKATGEKVNRLEVTINLNDKGRGKAYFLAKLLGEKMKKALTTSDDNIWEEDDEDRMNYGLKMSSDNIREFRLRESDDSVSITVSFN